MSFYRSNIVVKYNNHQLEGFSCESLQSENDAELKAKSKAFNKARYLQLNIDNLYFLTEKDFKALDKREQKELQLDWKQSIKGLGEL